MKPRLVMIDTKKHYYEVFEGRKSVAGFRVKNAIPLTAFEVEELRNFQDKALQVNPPVDPECA